MSAAPLVDAYLDQLGQAGITLMRRTAEAMIGERVQRFARGTGLTTEQAHAFFDADLMRSWAREAAAQYRDEQPHDPRVGEVPTELAPIALLAACIVELIDGDPAGARKAAQLLRAYPAILLGGVAVCRCPLADLSGFATALAGRNAQLAERFEALAESARRRG